ncbi:unnamed protein product [Vicia faba]|uniref:Uncharacterized protein n=1 Tax=Vicia faba TaxID=3906 RepID=A0AAV0Z884_VICFA|nr:unnamed protein product [Vicia faba]
MSGFASFAQNSKSMRGRNNSIRTHKEGLAGLLSPRVGDPPALLYDPSPSLEQPLYERSLIRMVCSHYRSSVACLSSRDPLPCTELITQSQPSCACKSRLPSKRSLCYLGLESNLRIFLSTADGGVGKTAQETHWIPTLRWSLLPMSPAVSSPVDLAFVLSVEIFFAFFKFLSVHAWGSGSISITIGLCLSPSVIIPREETREKLNLSVPRSGAESDPKEKELEFTSQVRNSLILTEIFVLLLTRLAAEFKPPIWRIIVSALPAARRAVEVVDSVQSAKRQEPPDLMGGIPMKEAHLEGAISSKSSVSEWSHPVHDPYVGMSSGPASVGYSFSVSPSSRSVDSLIEGMKAKDVPSSGRSGPKRESFGMVLGFGKMLGPTMSLSTYGILQDMTLYAMALRHRKWVLLPSKYGTEGVAELTQGRKDKSFALTPTRVAKVGRGPTAELHSIDMSVIIEKRAGHRLFTGDERPAEGHESPRKSVDQSKVSRPSLLFSLVLERGFEGGGLKEVVPSRLQKDRRLHYVQGLVFLFFISR